MNKEYIINEKIRSDFVDLILKNGKINEKILIKEAFEMAEDFDLDVVQILKSSKNGIPLCKLMDYGKFKYKNTKKNKNNYNSKIKKIRYNLNISDHDLQVKHKKVISFLEKKIKVKYTLELRGRQSNMIKSGRNKIMVNLEKFKDIAKWEEPKMTQGDSFTSFSTILISS